MLLSDFRGCAKTLRMAESADRQALTQGARHYIATLMSSSTSKVLVAESLEAEGVCCGWLIADEFLGRSSLIYAYTKSVYRNSGVCRQLMQAAFGEDGLPEVFGIYHGAFAKSLRVKRVPYCPFAAMLIGKPSELAKNLLEVK